MLNTMMIRIFFIAVVIASVAASEAVAGFGAYSFDRNTTVVGSTRTYHAKPGESLIEIARKYALGYNEIAAANPSLDPFVPGAGSSVTLATSWILPEVNPQEGIIINLSELRLFLFSRDKGLQSVRTFPIGIGSEGNDTPLGEFKIIGKEAKPSWHVPESIRKERPELPKVVPPGPRNPLGSHALRLSLGDVLIHGTNRPWGVGRRVSHGCIRLYPEDIPKLYDLVPVGTRVTIVRQPVKAGERNGKVFIEVHDDGSEVNYFNEAVRLLTKKGLLKRTHAEKLYRAADERKGLPVDISE